MNQHSDRPPPGGPVLRTWSPIFLLLFLLLPPSTSQAQVELRDKSRLDLAVIDISVAGVRVGPADNSPTLEQKIIAWDRIRKVEGKHAAAAASFDSIADKAWRARTRIERNDFTAAEPLLEDLAQTYAAEDGPTAAMISEGLLRCRLARGAQASAIWAWLQWTGQREHSINDKKSAAPWIGGSFDLTPIIDPGYLLVSQLPPVWLPVSSTSAAAISPEWAKTKNAGGDAASIAILFEAAARFEAGLDRDTGGGAPSIADTSTPAVSLVRDMVASRIGSDDDRAAARQSLIRRLDLFSVKPGANKQPPPRWLEAWCRIGIGRSLIREHDPDQRALGIIELLHLPARFADDQPYLAGVALAEAAVAMADLSDDDAATSLKTELVSRFPDHPSLEWDRIKKIPARKTTSANSTAAQTPVIASR